MTSGEYAYSLLRHLQRHFRCSDSGYRMYLYNFFGDLFKYPGIELTEITYQNFLIQMEKDCAYYASKNLTSLDAIHNDENFNTSFSMLKDSFAELGIQLKLVSTSGFYLGDIDFTMPDGVVLRLNSGYAECSYLCARTGAEMNYAKSMMPYYSFDEEDPQRLEDVSTTVAGYGTYWGYDGAGELEITGEGSLASRNLFSALGIASKVTTLILGAGVNELMTNALYYTNAMTIVCLRGAKDPMKLGENFSGSDSTSDSPTYYNWTIYTDNEDLKAATFRNNVTITFKPLSEWQG